MMTLPPYYHYSFIVSSIVILHTICSKLLYEVIYDPTKISPKSPQPTPVKANNHKGFSIYLMEIYD